MPRMRSLERVSRLPDERALVRPVVRANEGVLGRIAQLADGGHEALTKLDVELDGSDSVFGVPLDVS